MDMDESLFNIVRWIVYKGQVLGVLEKTFGKKDATKGRNEKKL
jgi:hypothetical protein